MVTIILSIVLVTVVISLLVNSCLNLLVFSDVFQIVGFSPFFLKLLFHGLVTQDFLGFLPSPLMTASHSLCRVLCDRPALWASFSTFFFSFYTVSKQVYSYPGFMLYIDNPQIYSSWMTLFCGSPDSCNCLQDMSVWLTCQNIKKHHYHPAKATPLISFSSVPTHPLKVIQARNLSYPLLNYIQLLLKLALHSRQGPCDLEYLCLPSTISFHFPSWIWAPATLNYLQFLQLRLRSLSCLVFVQVALHGISLLLFSISLIPINP